ncbi:MAG: ATP-binding protein [Fibrobacteria bacterium]|nr:ATP-binding protein [Fibrobacteria bacterium]
MFYGRKNELNRLSRLLKKKVSSLVICRGRRRIGKSTLIHQYAKSFDQFYEFQGLAPEESNSINVQLQAFSTQLAQQTSIPELKINSWSEAFSLLNSQIDTSKKSLIFLDEISWMAQGEKNFSGYLKIAWDTQFKKYPNLVVVVCGSVSSWIDENILKNTGYVGRVSLDIFLEELPLYYCNCFWNGPKKKFSTLEKLKTLSITGGVPRYLEEIDITMPAETNIKSLCFSSNGFLFKEFDHMFSSLFKRKGDIYKAILNSLAAGNKTLTSVAESLNRQKNGDFSKYLNDMEQSGFIKNEHTFVPLNQKLSKLSKYRISDNYIRFYLRYIDPIFHNISQRHYEKASLDQIIKWDTILGIQFETLILNNTNIIIQLLSIPPGTILNASPYFQRKTNTQLACQVDLLIQSHYTLYICEIKCKKNIGKSVINEVKSKVQKIKIPKNTSFRTVLIYEGKLSKAVVNENYFDHLITFEDILNQPD